MLPNIDTYNETPFLIDPSQVAALVTFVLKEMRVSCNQLAIYFVSREKISQLHGEFFDDPSPTDCITFPLDEPGPEAFLGEVFVCPEVAQEYATAHQLLFSHEVTLYVIHGLLHLIGFEDEEEEKAKEMHALQEKLLNQVKEEHLLLLP